MRRQVSDRSAAAVFIVLVLGIAVATANVAGGLILALSPVLVTVLLLAFTRDSRTGWDRAGLFRSGVRQWPLAVGGSVAVSVVATGLVVLLGYASFTSPGSDMWMNMLVLAITGPILAFAEEIGWRGYLLPRVMWLGERRAMLLVGVVWAAWHLPYILFTPYYHSEGNRLLTLSLFIGSVLAFSFFFGYLRLASDSVWPPVLAHFAHNWAFAVLPAIVATDHPVVFGEYLAGDTGLFVMLGTGLLACLLAGAWRRRLVLPERSAVSGKI
ncbi:CPBP family intramembrane glutamic endopeptidase [Nocardia ninae]|uniref:CAAX prenyl protease 2/Lysostaphin resistance protein A-like domain-containing protein n=1 Tax=Nocardia ninae NBRC 108245 TaxID=1210091 RepID=A0A511MD93_9NOCA|nr:CPBP family intramembrane glutamic endopeptidase [Nocardia ninae]GEM37766.1 hypothetical protein NN4_22850 [Nocardia ninae NBRC 108245]